MNSTVHKNAGRDDEIIPDVWLSLTDDGKCVVVTAGPHDEDSERGLAYKIESDLFNMLEDLANPYADLIEKGHVLSQEQCIDVRRRTSALHQLSIGIEELTKKLDDLIPPDENDLIEVSAGR